MDRERIDLIVHQYLGTIRKSMMDSYESNTDYVASVPGFHLPATIDRNDIPRWLDDLAKYMEKLI